MGGSVHATPDPTREPHRGCAQHRVTSVTPGETPARRSARQEEIRPMPNPCRATLLGAAFLALACGAPPVPGPGPAPGPFDCSAAAGISGVVAVEDPVPDRYIVVLSPPGPGMRPAAERVATLSSDPAVRDVVTFSRAIEGFAGSMDRSAAERIAQDPGVAFVQQVGTKRVAPIPSEQIGATWGLDRTDQRGLPLDGSYDPGAV